MPVTKAAAIFSLNIGSLPTISAGGTARSTSPLPVDAALLALLALALLVALALSALGATGARSSGVSPSSTAASGKKPPEPLLVAPLPLRAPLLAWGAGSASVRSGGGGGKELG